MAVFEIGRVAMKIAGREAGNYCVVVKPAGSKKEERNFVFVTGPKLMTGIKRRKCNVDHLRATEHKIEIKEDATDEEVIAAYEKSGLLKILDLKKPSAAKMKSRKEKPKKLTLILKFCPWNITTPGCGITVRPSSPILKAKWLEWIGFLPDGAVSFRLKMTIR